MADLRKFRDKLGALRLFDPACGCGNFLIIAYRELRTLEIDVLREIASRASATQLALTVQSVVDVDQFYGIEIGEFPARIAATALWMMDHIMNNRLSLEFGQTYARIPIEKSPHIRNADALEIDWADVLPPNECSYVFGNPPFGGAKFQSPEQRAQVRRIAALGGSGGTLRLRDRVVHPRQRLRAAGATTRRSETAADRLRGDQLGHAGASSWRNSRRCCLTTAASRSPSLIGPSHGVLTLAARPTSTSSSSG